MKAVCCKCHNECSLDAVTCPSCYAREVFEKMPFNPDYTDLQQKIDNLDKKLNEVLKFISFKKIKG